jgi:hypothetical protein
MDPFFSFEVCWDNVCSKYCTDQGWPTGTCLNLHECWCHVKGSEISEITEVTGVSIISETFN